MLGVVYVCPGCGPRGPKEGMAGLAYGGQTLGALARAGDLEALELKMRWESKSPNDPVRACVPARDQHCTRCQPAAGSQEPAASSQQPAASSERSAPMLGHTDQKVILCARVAHRSISTVRGTRRFTGRRQLAIPTHTFE